MSTPNLLVTLTSASIGLLVLGPLLAHFRQVAPFAGFGMFLLGCALGMFGVLASAAALSFDRAPASMAWTTLLLCVPGVVVVALIVKSAIQVPRINDVAATEGPVPGFFRAGFPPYSDATRAAARKGYPDLEPLKSPLAPSALYARALQVGKEKMGWAIEAEEPGVPRFEAFVETQLFRFRDDMVVEIVKMGEGSLLRIRSRSRDGSSDFGVNAARIREFLGALR